MVTAQLFSIIVGGAVWVECLRVFLVVRRSNSQFAEFVAAAVAAALSLDNRFGFGSCCNPRAEGKKRAIF
jgi:hypothetical protein